MSAPTPNPPVITSGGPINQETPEELKILAVNYCIGLPLLGVLFIFAIASFTGSLSYVPIVNAATGIEVGHAKFSSGTLDTIVVCADGGECEGIFFAEDWFGFCNDYESDDYDDACLNAGIANDLVLYLKALATASISLSLIFHLLVGNLYMRSKLDHLVVNTFVKGFLWIAMLGSLVSFALWSALGHTNGVLTLEDGELFNGNDILWSEARLGSDFALLVVVWLFAFLFIVALQLEGHRLKKKDAAYAADVLGCVNVPLPAKWMQHRRPDHNSQLLARVRSRTVVREPTS